MEEDILSFADLCSGFSTEEQRRIEQAVEFAARMHAGQKRKSGEPFIVHPVGAARILLRFDDDRVDCDLVCAMLLHDTVEDTKATLDQIRDAFGERIAWLVGSVTEDKTRSGPILDRDRIFFDEILQAAKEDERVLLMKLADVLHNYQTLHVYSDDRRKHIEDVHIPDFYVPIARRLGYDDLADQLLQFASSESTASKQ